MKLPISIFPNITEYTKANWKGYLEPRDITVTNHTDLGSDVTWEMFDKGTIHIHKPYSQSVRNALMEWTTKCPDNTKVVVMFRRINGYSGLASQANIFSGVACTKKMDDGNTAIYVSDTNSWTLTGLTFDIAVSWASDIYISLVNGDRLDACLSGNHLKPISVGDKLGLVYWDGTECTEAGESMFCSTNDVYNVLVASYSPQNYGYGLKLLYNTTGKRTEPFLTKAGTVNLSGYDVKITGIETKGETLLKDHLFHVI